MSETNIEAGSVFTDEKLQAQLSRHIEVMVNVVLIYDKKPSRPKDQQLIAQVVAAKANIMDRYVKRKLKMHNLKYVSHAVYNDLHPMASQRLRYLQVTNL